jgi:hypothetical protein
MIRETIANHPPENAVTKRYRHSSAELLISGYRGATADSVRSYAEASHKISRSRASAGSVIGLAPSFLTEVVLRPARAR